MESTLTRDVRTWGTIFIGIWIGTKIPRWSQAALNRTRWAGLLKPSAFAVTQTVDVVLNESVYLNSISHQEGEAMGMLDFQEGTGAWQLAQKCVRDAMVAFGAGMSVLWAMIHIDERAIPRVTNWLMNEHGFDYAFYPTMFLAALTFASIGREWRHDGLLCRALGGFLATKYSATAGLIAGWIGTFLALGVANDHRRLHVAIAVGCLTLVTLMTPAVILLSARHIADKVSARRFVHEWRLRFVRGAGFFLAAVACWGFVERVVLIH